MYERERERDGKDSRESVIGIPLRAGFTGRVFGFFWASVCGSSSYLVGVTLVSIETWYTYGRVFKVLVRSVVIGYVWVFMSHGWGIQIIQINHVTHAHSNERPVLWYAKL